MLHQMFSLKFVRRYFVTLENSIIRLDRAENSEEKIEMAGSLGFIRIEPYGLGLQVLP